MEAAAVDIVEATEEEETEPTVAAAAVEVLSTLPFRRTASVRNLPFMRVLSSAHARLHEEVYQCFVELCLYTCAVARQPSGLIIGKGGARIKDIEYRVGCPVRVRNDGSGNHWAQVQGTEAQYKQVQEIIDETVRRQETRVQY